MVNLKDLPFSGLIVIFIILCLFVLSIIILLSVYGRYKILSTKAHGNPETRPNFLRHVYNDYKSAYEQFGEDTNTPAIIENCINTKLGGLLLCERFLNNAVSLFVTLGLFGTFLGLSLSVGSLTELLSGTNSTEWLSVLDNVGGGLLSALSGMGVAFYTSLVGVACSIILTILKAIFSPETVRETLQTRTELWLDADVAPTLKTTAIKGDADLVKQMMDALASAAIKVEGSINNASNALLKVTAACERQLGEFDTSIDRFNKGVHDFSEVDYNLRGSIERMDLSVRELRATVKDISKNLEGSAK